MKKLNHICKFLLIPFILMLSVVANANIAQNPYQLMKVTTDKLFAHLTQDQQKIKDNPEYLRTIIRNDLMPYVHVKYAGSLILGSYYKTSTPAQRDEYFKALDLFIEQTYAQIMTMYSNQKVIIEKEKPFADRNVINIRARVIQPDNKPELKLDFKWRKNSKSKEWQVYDVILEGVSMIETKKNEWNVILRKDGIEKLTEELHKLEKTAITLDNK